MDVPQFAQRPRSTSQETIGMFCSAVMGALQDGQAERGTTRLNGSSGRAGTVAARGSFSTSSMHADTVPSPGPSLASATGGAGTVAAPGPSLASATGGAGTVAAP